MMKIAIFTDTFPPEINGVATSCLSLMNSLKEHGHEVYLFKPGSKTSYDLANKIITLKGIELKSLYGYRLVNPCRNSVLKFVKTLNLDLIHTNTEYGVGILAYRASKKLNIPLVYTYHTNLEDYTYYISKGFKPFDYILKKLLHVTLRKYCRDAYEIIAPSEETKKYLTSIDVRHYINVIPTGFNFDRFLKTSKEDERIKDIKNKYNIDDKTKIFLALGRIAKEKNFELIIRYYKKYLETTSFLTKLMIVGDGPNINNIKKLTNELKLNDYIIFTGKVMLDEVNLYYGLADIYLNASTTETQGLTYMEAMATKLILLTKRANFLDGVIEDSKNGFYFENENEFIDKINYILNLTNIEKEKIINNALLTIDNYSSDNFYKNIMVAYNRALKDKY